MSESAAAALLFLQIAVILVTCGALARVMTRIGQPRVVAEMVAGFVLGPSILGLFAGGAYSALFPPESLRAIYLLSQFGLVLYMFCVGLEFRLDVMAGLRKQAIAVSAAGIAGPFILGVALALPMQRSGGLFPANVTPVQAALFLGSAMSITAFPVLARIIRERGIGATGAGALALSAGAFNDLAAWMILAVVLGSMSGQAWGALSTVLGAFGYAVVAIYAVRPVLRWLFDNAERQGFRNAPLMAVMALLMVAAWFTERIGVHAVFGAFLLGVSVPRGVFSEMLMQRVDPVASGVLVPLFFVYAGLHTEVRLVQSLDLWVLTLVVLVTACGGKGIFCWLAARATGASARSALVLATLMNARGMVELILLNIGLARGLITPVLYTILVLMAVATTVMTGPLLSLVWNGRHEQDLVGGPPMVGAGMS